MKTGLVSNLSKVFLMSLQMDMDPKRQASGRIRLGLLGPDDFLVPVEFPLPPELSTAINAFVDEVEEWAARQHVLFSATQKNNTVVSEFDDSPPKNLLVTEEDS